MRLLYAQIIVVIITCCTPLKGRISEETIEVDINSSAETNRDVEFANKNLETAMNSLNALELISGAMDRQTSSEVNLEKEKKSKNNIDQRLNEAIKRRANVITLLAQIFGELGTANIEIEPSGNASAYIESLSFRENLKTNQRLFLKIESHKLRGFEEPNSQSIGLV